MQKWVRLWGAHSVDQGSPGTDHRRRTFLLPLAPALPFPALETGQRLGGSPSSFLSVIQGVC